MKNKRNLIISFVFVCLLFSGCGRKAMPFVPEKETVPKPENLEIVSKDQKHTLFFDNKGNADYFILELSKTECESCPDSFVKIAEIEGERNYHVFSDFGQGRYKLRLTAVKNNRKSKPALKEFEIR
jgi:predicted small lipoprotein YifL